MKKTLFLVIISIGILTIISWCSINIEKDQDKNLQEQLSWLQEQLSWLQQKVNTLEIENTELKKNATSTPVKKTTTQPKEMDNCPNGDKTISRYDWDCWECDWGGVYKNGKCVYYLN